MILVDIIYTCDRCLDTTIVEHNDLTIGERPPALQMPAGWNGVDTGVTLCPKCCEEPVEPEKMTTIHNAHVPPPPPD